MAQHKNDLVQEEANKILAYLSKEADKNWVGVMTDTLTDLERKTAHAALAKVDGDTPYGAFVGGTGALKEAAGVERQEAIQILKASNRLLQCGKGRGKCQIVIDVSELGDDEFRRARAAITPKKTPAAKPKAAARVDEIADDPTIALREAFDRFLSYHADCVNERNQAIAERDADREELAKVRGLLEEVEKLRAASTW